MKNIDKELKESHLSNFMIEGIKKILTYSERHSQDYEERLSIIDRETQKYMEKLSPLFALWCEDIKAQPQEVAPYLSEQISTLLFDTVFNIVCERSKPSASLEPYFPQLALLFKNISAYTEESVGCPLVLDLSNRLVAMRPRLCAMILLESSIAINYKNLKMAQEEGDESYYSLTMNFEKVFNEIEKLNTQNQGIVLAPDMFKIVCSQGKNNFLSLIRNYEATPVSCVVHLKLRQLNESLPTTHAWAPDTTHLDNYLNKMKVLEEKKSLEKSVSEAIFLPIDENIKNKKVAKL